MNWAILITLLAIFGELITAIRLLWHCHERLLDIAANTERTTIDDRTLLVLKMTIRDAILMSNTVSVSNEQSETPPGKKFVKYSKDGYFRSEKNGKKGGDPVPQKLKEEVDASSKRTKFDITEPSQTIPPAQEGGEG